MMSATVHDADKVNIEHLWETMSALPESVIRNCVQCPSAEITHDVSSSSQDNIIISETVHDGDNVSVTLL